MKIILMCMCFGFFAGIAFGQEMITDRPDQSESPDIVPQLTVQLESGLSIETVKGKGSSYLKTESSESSVYSNLIRYGALKNVELRAEFDIISERSQIVGGVTGEITDKTGLLPVSFGTKISIMEQKKFLPKTALLLALSLPKLASHGFFSESAAPSFRFCMSNEVSERISISYNLGAEWDGDSPETTGIYSLSLGAELLKNLNSFVEVYGFIPDKGDNENFIDGGLTYLIAKNFQADISGGIGLNNELNSNFISFGLSLRLPK